MKKVQGYILERERERERERQRGRGREREKDREFLARRKELPLLEKFTIFWAFSNLVKFDPP